MKRCPQCSFLYLDTDEVCDLDGTPVVSVSESELEGSLTRTTSSPPLSERPGSSVGRKPLIFTALGGLLLGILLFLGYFVIAKRSVAPAQSQQPIAQVNTPSPVEPLISPTAMPSPTAELSPSPSEKPAPSPVARSTR